MFEPHLKQRAAELVALYAARGLTLVTAESCTGGLVAGLIVGVPGSSAVLERGFVTYSNDAKAQSLGVPRRLLDTYGAVSPQVAGAMATGALDHSLADVAVSVTGIAGPGGGTPQKPVGLVDFACARRGGSPILVQKRFGDIGRMEIRLASIDVALAMLAEVLA